MRFSRCFSSFLLRILLMSSMMISTAITGCVDAKATSAVAAPVDVMRGMMIVEGTARRCFVRFKSDGELVAAEWCWSSVPDLLVAVGWKWLDGDLVLVNSQDQEIVRLVKENGVRLWRHRGPGGYTIVFYPFSPEVQPHLK